MVCCRNHAIQRDQRRLIDISPGGMFSARQVVELIAKVSVVGSGKEVENDTYQATYTTMAVPDVKGDGFMRLGFADGVAKSNASSEYQMWLKGLDKVRKIVSDSLYSEW
jgi:hypothetical protein